MSETRTRIKICGITNTEDARAAVDAGADALGFILVPETPRFVTWSTFQPILRELPPFVQSVAVTIKRESHLESIQSNFSAVQYYEGAGNRSEGYPLRFIRAFPVRDASSLKEIEAACAQFLPDAIHLDTYHKDKLGGSGETFNWDLAIEAKERFGLPIVLAGGLTPENVEEAIVRVRPYAVDVSSGVEAEPGRKDHAKLRAFIQAVKRADARFEAHLTGR
jgi:phosphoribosylanthranilate isomerase